MTDNCCIFHCVEDCKETVFPVTLKQWNTAVTYANSWQTIHDDVCSEIAVQILSAAKCSDEMVAHQSCYSKFTNKLGIERAEGRPGEFL